MGILTDSCVAK